MLPAGIEIALEKIDDDVAGTIGRKSIAMKGYAFGGGELDLYVMVLQPDRVIIRPGDLLAMRVMGGITRSRISLGTCLCPYRTGIRHDQDIAKIGDTGAVEMVLSKTFDDAVGVMVTGTPVPALVDVAGANLYGAEGNAGTEKDMAMTAGADVRVYIRKDAGTTGGRPALAGSGSAKY